jgi:hypothetical protein
MRATIVCVLLASLMTLASAQVREVWRYVYTPPQDDLAAHLERAVRLSDGGLMLLGWVETPLNGRDALAIRLLPNGAEAWVYRVDGASFDDAFVDAVESANEMHLLGQFTDADGYLYAQVHRLTPAGQPIGVITLSRNPNSHIRPLRFLYYYEVSPAIAAEAIANGTSRLGFYEPQYPSSQYLWYCCYDMRPWGVLPGDGDLYRAGFVYGTVATVSTALDTVFCMFDSPFFRYHSRGVDIPAVGAEWRQLSTDHYVGVQAEDSRTGEDVVLFCHPSWWGNVRWGYRYTNQWHDDYAEDLAVDAQGNASLLVKSILWRGEPYERRTMRLVRFSENGRLLSDAELAEFGHPHLSGFVRINDAGQRFVAIVGAFSPDAPPSVSRLARVDASGRFLWQLPSDIEYDALFAEPEGNLLAAGSQVFEGQNYYDRYRRIVAVKYAPNGDIDGSGCVDDADLLRVLFAFGQQGADLAADLNGDARVDDADLLVVLFALGEGC